MTLQPPIKGERHPWYNEHDEYSVTIAHTASRPVRPAVLREGGAFALGSTDPMEASRFWARVDRSGECWEWRGDRNSRGYGVVRVGRRDGPRTAAHRAAYQLTHGPIPDGLLVCHSCDNRGCVRPSHLWLGTHADNIRDRDAKGRTATGDRNGSRTHPRSAR